MRVYVCANACMHVCVHTHTYTHAHHTCAHTHTIYIYIYIYIHTPGLMHNIHALFGREEGSGAEGLTETVSPWLQLFHVLIHAVL